MRNGFELLIDPPLMLKAEKFMNALRSNLPPGGEVQTSYKGDKRVLVLYGPGAPRRLAIIRKHRAAGGRVAMWDLGYWDRKHGMRLAVDHLHPSAEHLAMAPEGPGRREFALRNDADPAGPVLLVGLGPKSCVAWGLKPMQWEREKLADLWNRFPRREIRWRPKGEESVALAGTTLTHGMPIEEALKGCSLVVCRHSNVAVDACVAGIPVECEDGAALALYRGNPNPSPAERAEFLRRLSWWEWRRSEPEAAWSWIAKVTA